MGLGRPQGTVSERETEALMHRGGGERLRGWNTDELAGPDAGREAGPGAQNSCGPMAYSLGFNPRGWGPKSGAKGPEFSEQSSTKTILLPQTFIPPGFKPFPFQ